MRTTHALAIVFLAAATFPVAAATAYKCIDARGAVTFQDKPCPAGAKQSSMTLPDPEPVAPAPVASEPPPPPNPGPDPLPLPPPVVRDPPQQFYLCTRYDGTTYISDTGEGGSALVPLGVMGVPGRSLADAYGGRNGIGVSAPGLRQIPHVPAGSTPFGGMSTWIDDECHMASPQEACGYLRNALDDVEYKLRKAFSDTTPELKRQRADIQERMRGC
ncbi:MAG TPA: DUF4124 domain-containing protein [Rhodanobacteraceae bacterium]|nr:DUF4124 domain-containing protein [Rhodanobacteraceae bacterium]